MLHSKRWQVLHRIRISMLAGFKVSSLTCVFYRPELNTKGDLMELNFEGLEMKHTTG